MASTRGWTAVRWTAALGLTAVVAAVLLTWRDDTPTRASLASSPGTSVAPSDPPASPGAPSGPSRTPATPARTPSSPPGTPPSTPASPTLPIATDAGPPSPPDAALGLAVPSAEALIWFYFGQAHNYLKATGDGAAVERWSDPSCTECRRLVTFFRTRNARNKLVTGDFWYRDIRVTRFELTGKASAEADVTMRVGRYDVRPYRRLPPGHSTGETVDATVTLVARSNHWTIFDLEGRPS